MPRGRRDTPNDLKALNLTCTLNPMQVVETEIPIGCVVYHDTCLGSDIDGSLALNLRDGDGEKTIA